VRGGKDGIALMATGEKSDKGERVHRERAREIKSDRETSESSGGKREKGGREREVSYGESNGSRERERRGQGERESGRE
jgi:hypothetical protein